MVNEWYMLMELAPEANSKLPMPSMVLVGDLGSHWGPPGAFGGPQTGSNTPVRRERLKLKRFGTVSVQVLPWLSRGAPLAE